MSFVIQAPYPLMQTALVMPSPRRGNTRKLAATVETLRAMDGTLYTYVKGKRNRKVHKWDFTGTKDKAREAVQFVREYSGGLVRVTDHEGSTILGYITVNPLEIEGQGRAGGFPSNEVYNWSISIEEKV